MLSLGSAAESAGNVDKRHSGYAAIRHCELVERSARGVRRIARRIWAMPDDQHKDFWVVLIRTQSGSTNAAPRLCELRGLHANEGVSSNR